MTTRHLFPVLGLPVLGLPVLALLGLLVLGPAAFGASPPGAASPGAGEILLVEGAGKRHLLHTDGSAVAEMPPSARIHSVATTDSAWYAAGIESTPDGHRLLLRKGSGERVKALPTPEVGASAELREPTVLTTGNGLAGLAWIEGEAPRRQSVRAALWTAGGFREPVTVSPPGPGSQLALVAAPLGVDSWLLAWSAFDGEDDEILWSRLGATGATSPARLTADNTVPDITPSLAATGEGTLLAAWSRYDGNDYRVVVARFDGAAWTTPEEIGPAGSVYPTFQVGAGAPPLLVYLETVPRAWTAVELDTAGAVRRRATLPTEHAETPVARRAADGVTFFWTAADGALESVPSRPWQSFL